MCRAFDLDESVARPIYFTDPFFDLGHKRALVDEPTETLLSCLTVVPATIRVAGGATLPVAGIAGVGTDPENRQRGYAGELLSATVKQVAAELGYPLIALVTDKPDFYRRFGWECCAAVFEWAAPAGVLPRYFEGRAVKLLNPAELQARNDQIHALYERARSGRAGTFLRDHRRWFCIETFSRNRQVAVLENGSRIEAYVAFEDRNEYPAERSLLVQEMIAVSENGRRAILGYLAQQNADITIHGRTSATDFAAFRLDRLPGLRVKILEGMMLRVTDMEACLAAIAQSGHFTPVLQQHPSGLTIRIENANLSHNNKPIRLFPVIDSDRLPKLAMSPADELEGLWISADVGAFTQLFIGYRSATELHSEGRLRASQSHALTLADHLFPLADPFLALPDTF